jgi:hypothetical protein
MEVLPKQDKTKKETQTSVERQRDTVDLEEWRKKDGCRGGGRLF